MKLGIKPAVVFVLALLIIGIVGIQSYLGIQRLIEANRWVIHTHEVMEKLEHVLSLLKDAETGQRGFILTGEDRYLKPYNSATGEIRKNIEAVTSLTRDNPEQQKSLRQLEKLSRDKLDELGETIKLRREEGSEAALVVIRRDRGKRIMDEIRALLNQMESHESELLDRRNRVAGEVARQSMRTLGIGVLLSLVFIGIAAVIGTSTMRLADHSLVSRYSGRKWGGIAIRYAFAVVMVVLAIYMRWWLVRSFGPMPLFIALYPAVLLVAAVAGGGPGVAATLLSTLAADYWFIEPIGQFSIASANDAVALGIFTGTGICLSVLAERLQRARRAEAVSVTQERELALLNMGNLMVLDLDHHIVRWSEGNHRLYGFDAQVAQGQLTYELLQTHFDQPREQIQSELLEKGYWEGDATRRSKEGSQLSVAILWALRRDEHGKPLAILEVSTDMTRQKLAEGSLQQTAEELAHQNEELSQQSEELTQQSEELAEINEELQTQSEEIQALNVELGQREKTLQTLLDSARLPIGEYEVLGKICHLATEMIGFPGTGAVICEQHGDELKILASAGFDSDVFPGSWPKAGSFVEVVMQQDRTACLEDTSLRSDLNILSVPGHQQFGSVLSSPLRVKGRPIGAVSIYSNKTQQWTVEQFRLIEWLAYQCSNTLEAMRLSAEVLRERKLAAEAQGRLAAIVESAEDAIIGEDLNAVIQTWNAGAENIFGYKAEEVTGKSVSLLIPPGNLDEVPEILARIKKGEHIENFETVRMRKDRTIIPVSLTLSAVKDASGRIIGASKIAHDITERKRAEKVIVELNRNLTTRNSELVTANRELEAFSYSVSHDLRAPLRHISGYMELLTKNLGSQAGDKAKHYMTVITGASKKMNMLIDDLLAFSRMGRTDMKKTTVNIPGIVRDVIREMAPDIKDRDVEWKIGALPDVHGDTNMLRLAIVNLISNAIKYTVPSSKAEIEIGCTEEAEEFIFFVKDNGVGFDMEYVDKLFGVFQRLHQGDEFEGTGIGLANVQRIISRHGGRTWAKGAVGQGAVFYFSIPKIKKIKEI